MSNDQRRVLSGVPGVASGTPPAPKEKKWYIVHTYSGQEQRAKQGLLERARSCQREEFFDEVLIPEENVVEVVKGQKRTSKRKFFPGYILVRMDLNDETWHIVKGTPLYHKTNKKRNSFEKIASMLHTSDLDESEKREDKS